jgi:hypothetical protein
LSLQYSPDAEQQLAWLANAQQSLAAFEIACALRLHALENGTYPERLDALEFVRAAPGLLRPTGPVRLTYERDSSGCRLKWRAWKPSSRTTPDGKPAGEVLELSEKEAMLELGPVSPPVPSTTSRGLKLHPRERHLTANRCPPPTVIIRPPLTMAPSQDPSAA